MACDFSARWPLGSERPEAFTPGRDAVERLHDDGVAVGESASDPLVGSQRLERAIRRAVALE